MNTTELRSLATRRLLAGLFFVIMAATPFIAHAAPTGEGWNGKIADKIENAAGNSGDTADKPIFIKKAAELAYLAQQANEGGYILELENGNKIDNTDESSKQGFSGYYFALSADIDLNGYEWTPIGNDTHPFKGHFNGDGHVVRGLKMNVEIKTKTTTYAGLFGYIENGTLRNLGVWLAPEGIEVSSTQFGYISAGGLAGYVTETDSKTPASIQNCYVEGEGNITVRSTDNTIKINVGGMVGVTNGNLGTCIITHCYTTVDVEAEVDSRSTSYVGSIAGRTSDISYTYATGNVKVKERKKGKMPFVGGICGHATNGTITNCVALNKEISSPGSDQCFRICRSGSGTNYASPRMIINGQPVTGNDPVSKNGTDIWLENFKETLSGTSGNNEWTTAWSWTEGELPRLKKLNTDGTTYSNELISGQKVRSQSACLYHSTWESKTNIAQSIENAPPAGTDEPGDGLSPDKPILIKNAAELAYLAQQVNAGGYVLEFSDGSKIDNASEITKRGFSGYYFSLSDDIKLEGGNWIPIGDDNSFRGHFDGKGHTVDGLRVDVVKENSSENTSDNTPAYAGLFGYVEDGTLCNLGVRLHEDGIKAVSNKNDAFAGGIVGLQIGFEDNTLLRNCFVVGNGKVEATAEFSVFAGGIAGLISFSVPNSATLTHCYATVDVEATANITCCAGGIAGSSYGRLSYTYATGSVKTNKTNQYAGGICGDIVSGELTHSLALNSEVTANGANAHRIASNSFPPDPPSDLLPVLDTNYARPAMLLNNGSDSGSTTVTSPDGTSLDGADTWLDTFADNLASDDATNEGWKSGAWTRPTAPSTLLPKLALVTFDDSGTPNGFTPWPAPATTVTSGTLGSPVISVAQPDLDAADYLVNRPLLHVTQPAEGGTLAVYLADPANPTAPAPGTPPLTDGTNGSESIPVVPGTALWLTNIPKAGYDFKAYLSGPASDGVTQPVSGQSLTMTAADLWITASFTAQAPPPPTPVYYDVTLPSVEGATTDPAAGTYSVEAKESFRFFLTLDEAYSQSQPVVITDRGETITPRTSDGAYIVKTVHSDVSISIAGIVENAPVANESIAAPSDALRIWTEPGTLCIDLDITNRTSTDTDTVPSVRIISADGRLLHDFRPVPGLNRRNLAPGLYIIQAGQTVRKVIVK